MRILAVDLGERRIGLALSDEMEILASPLEVYQHKSDEASLQYLCELIKRRGVKEVVIGLPLDMKGHRGPKADQAQAFADELQKRVAIPVVLWDERLTTMQAQRSLLEADVSRAGRKETVDMIAAAVLLQSYLDRRRYQKDNPE